MTTPTPDITEIVPSKLKPWVGLVGSLLTLGVPYVLSVSDSLPAPWPLVVGLVIAVLGALGIYKAPYKPTGTVLAVDPKAEKVSDSVPANAPVAVHPNDAPPAGGYQNPWI